MNNNFKLPIPFPYIARWTDKRLVSALLKFEQLPTAEFFYGKAYPVFKSLYDRYITNCAEVIDFIHEIYIDVIRPRSLRKKCKLETFNYRCSLKNWIGVVAIRYCYAQYKKQIPIDELSVHKESDQSEPSILTDMGKLDREDVESILQMMPNKQYRELVRLRYLEDYDNEETAKILGMKMDYYYNKHRAAKLQYIQVFLKEMSK